MYSMISTLQNKTTQKPHVDKHVLICLSIRKSTKEYFKMLVLVI